MGCCESKSKSFDSNKTNDSKVNNKNEPITEQPTTEDKPQQTNETKKSRAPLNPSNKIISDENKEIDNNIEEKPTETSNSIEKSSNIEDKDVKTDDLANNKEEIEETSKIEENNKIPEIIEESKQETLIEDCHKIEKNGEASKNEKSNKTPEDIEENKESKQEIPNEDTENKIEAAKIPEINDSKIIIENINNSETIIEGLNIINEEPKLTIDEFNAEDNKIEEENIEKLKVIEKKSFDIPEMLKTFKGTKLEDDYYNIDDGIQNLMISIDNIKNPNKNPEIKAEQKRLLKQLQSYADEFDNKCATSEPTLTEIEREELLNKLETLKTKLVEIGEEIKKYDENSVFTKLDTDLNSLFVEVNEVDTKTDDIVEKEKRSTIGLIQNEMLLLAQASERIEKMKQ